MATETEQEESEKDKKFRHLTNTINRFGQPAHQAVAAYIRQITSGTISNLAIYHNSTATEDKTKIEHYRICFNALVKNGGPDYEALKSAMFEPVKKATEKAIEAMAETPRKRPTKPVDAPVEVEAIETPTSSDPLTKAILDTVLPHLNRLKVNAALDVDKVDEIARQVVNECLIGYDEGFRDKLEKHLNNGGFPIDKVTALIDKAKEEIVEQQVQRLVLCKLDGSTKEVEGRQHYKFPLLVAALSQRLNVALVGPAGSSKTTAAHMASKALDFEFEAISVGPMTSKADLLGFVDAHGKYHETSTVRRAEKGGIMLWDEFDAANASVATYGNMLLANEHFGTPEGMKQKHKDFCLVAGLNTYGMGANRVYVGRNQLDGATLDRFVVIDWDYDEGLEASIVGCDRPSPKLDMTEGGILEADKWLEYVVDVRRACEKLAIRHVVSPRATIHGVKLFLAGIGRTHVEKCVLFKGLEDATVNKIKNEI